MVNWRSGGGSEPLPWDNLDDYDDSEQIIHDTRDGKQLVIFVLGEEKYCVNILSVYEIISDIRITLIPNMPDYIKGILNLRGAVIPVIDMRIKFGLSDDHIDKYTVIMILKIHQRKIGIIVDVVDDVVFASDQEIVPSTRNLSIIDTEFIDGVLRPALYEPLCIDLFEVGQAQQAHDYDDGNLA